MKAKEWDRDIKHSMRHRTLSEMLAEQRTGKQYVRLSATRDLRNALTTLRQLGEKRETLKEAVDVVCNRISVGEEEK